MGEYKFNCTSGVLEYILQLLPWKDLFQQIKSNFNVFSLYKWYVFM